MKKKTSANCLQEQPTRPSPSAAPSIHSSPVSPVDPLAPKERKLPGALPPSSPVSGEASQKLASQVRAQDVKNSAGNGNTVRAQVLQRATPAKNPKMSLENLVSPNDEPHISPETTACNKAGIDFQASHDAPPRRPKLDLPEYQNYLYGNESHMGLTSKNPNMFTKYAFGENVLRPQEFPPPRQSPYQDWVSGIHRTPKPAQPNPLSNSAIFGTPSPVHDQKPFLPVPPAPQTAFSSRQFDSTAVSALSYCAEPKAKRPWTESEDVILRELVQKLGPGLWAAMAQQIPGRTGKQVRERWLNHLSPGVTKRPWSAEEDDVIIENHKRIGNCWSRIAKLLQGRSDNSVKNRYYTTLRRRISNGHNATANANNTAAAARHAQGRKRYLPDGITDAEAELAHKRARVWD